jgi:small conductance mechanosensitive channel
MDFKFDFDWMTMITSGAIIIATFVMAYMFRRVFNRFILNSTRLVKNDPTNYKFLKHAISSLIYIIGFSIAVYRIESLRTVASSLLAGAGILAVAIGFASQAALSNIISGLFIIIYKPFGVNDRITVRDTLRGVVEDITMRHTIIRDFENKRIVIPNSIISDEVVVNSDLGDGKICRFVEASCRKKPSNTPFTSTTARLNRWRKG